MPTIEVLRERREKLEQRQRKVDELILADELDLARILTNIEEERDERQALDARRKDLREAIEEEIRNDDRGKGEHPDHWETWAESRRDELADLIDACENRIDRMIERAAKEDKALKELKGRDSRLEHRIVKVQRKIDRKQIPAGQLTKDFHFAEFDCNDGTPVPTYMMGPLKALCIQHLQPLRNSGDGVHINSGYRHAAYNAAIGGASQSYHVYELRKTAPAADHIQAGRSATAVQAWHDTHNPPDGMGYYGGFTHIDDRGYRSRWWGAS